jgi:hypothetical protein
VKVIVIRACSGLQDIRTVAQSPIIQFSRASRVISAIINLVNSATHPSKYAAGHELLASFRLLL